MPYCNPFWLYRHHVVGSFICVLFGVDGIGWRNIRNSQEELKLSQYVNLDMTYTTYSQLCDAVMEATTHAEDFYEIQELVHLLDFLEEEYQRDLAKQNLDYETWKLHEELFRNKEIYHR